MVVAIECCGNKYSELEALSVANTLGFSPVKSLMVSPNKKAILIGHNLPSKTMNGADLAIVLNDGGTPYGSYKVFDTCDKHIVATVSSYIKEQLNIK